MSKSLWIFSVGYLWRIVSTVLTVASKRRLTPLLESSRRCLYHGYTRHSIRLDKARTSCRHKRINHPNLLLSLFHSCFDGVLRGNIATKPLYSQFTFLNGTVLH